MREPDVQHATGPQSPQSPQLAGTASCRLTHAEATTVWSWRWGWEILAISLNLGPGQWVALASSYGPLQDTAISLCPGALACSPAQSQWAWKALGKACNISLTKLFWEADSDGAGFLTSLMDLSSVCSSIFLLPSYSIFFGRLVNAWLKLVPGPSWSISTSPW